MSVYVLNMGQPVKIVELAERMIALSGLEPGRDIEIEFTGVRPGERLHEILFAHNEPTVEIGIAGIVAAKPSSPSVDAMRALARDAGAGARAQRPLGDLRRAARRGAGFPRRSRLNHRGKSRSLVSVTGRQPAASSFVGSATSVPARRSAYVALADRARVAADEQRGRHRDERRPAAQRRRAASRRARRR